MPCDPTLAAKTKTRRGWGTHTLHLWENRSETAYIKQRHLGGAYVWALNQDDAQETLTKAIAAGLK